jgi:hypothetical protein
MTTKPVLPAYYMSIEDEERLEHGPYESREQAVLDALELRQQIIEDHEWAPASYMVCKIIPSHENAIEQTSNLPFRLRDFIDEWVNDNVEGGSEDGVIEIQDSALKVLSDALKDVLTNHSVYLANGAPVECIETKFED